jgi:hypothetical protein
MPKQLTRLAVPLVALAIAILACTDPVEPTPTFAPLGLVVPSTC